MMIRAANVSQSILRRYEARMYIPAGLVEEKVLVWLLNAFDNYRCLVSMKPSKSSFSAATELRRTEELPVSRRIPIEDILSNIAPEAEGRGFGKKESVLKAILLISKSTEYDDGNALAF